MVLVVHAKSTCDIFKSQIIELERQNEALMAMQIEDDTEIKELEEKLVNLDPEANGLSVI